MKYCDSHVEFIHHPEDDAKLSNLEWVKSQISPKQINAVRPSLLFLAVFVDPGDNAWQKILWVVDEYLKVIAENKWILVRGKADLLRKGIKIILHIEDLSAIGRDLEKIGVLYDLGVRSIGLTHNYANQFAGGSLTPDIGLKSLGKQAIIKFRSAGIMLDHAHLSKKAVFDVYEQFELPVFISHTGVAGVYASPRNTDDDLLKLVAKSSGYIGIGCAGSFLAKEGATLSDYIAQIKYAQSISGPDRVGIGSDLGGVVSYLPANLQNLGDLRNSIGKIPSIQSSKALTDFLGAACGDHDFDVQTHR